MMSLRYKALAFAIASVSLMQCREPVDLQIRAEPAEQRHSSPENRDIDGTKDTNGPAIKEGMPAKSGQDKPVRQAGDTLLPKTA